MNKISYYSVLVTLFSAGVKEQQSVRFPIKTISERSVTLPKMIQKDLENRLKMAKIDGIILYPMSQSEIERNFQGEEATFPVYDFSEKSVTYCNHCRKEKCNMLAGQSS
jgi:hypothetical protein